MKRKDNDAVNTVRKRENLSEFGTFVWTVICEYCGPQQIMHPAAVISEMVGMSERTLHRRLMADDWLESELCRLAMITRSQRLIDRMAQRYQSITARP